MCSGLHGNKTTRYLLKYLFHRFRCRRHFLFQKDFARFIQNAVVRPAIAEVQSNRDLVSFENHVSIYANSASLFHSRSPFLAPSSASILGSLMHPAETGLLIPSDKRHTRRSDFSLFRSRAALDEATNGGKKGGPLIQRYNSSLLGTITSQYANVILWQLLRNMRRFFSWESSAGRKSGTPARSTRSGRRPHWPGIR